MEVKSRNSSELTCVVVVEKGVESGTVGKDILRINNTQAPCLGAVATLTRARAGEIGVSQC